ncbi:uncharacterized protein HHUB_2257 [Halobacterium hubeiense]|uniref:Uncharacterized protein n=1 Tax=Halobacterium hubeiense TaxID=1407499 RepID=A0A0U5H161_9EURY|nr:uncharacterized protein HHUB_2257 [Halobacterium hubeiense]
MECFADSPIRQSEAVCTSAKASIDDASVGNIYNEFRLSNGRRPLQSLRTTRRRPPSTITH